MPHFAAICPDLSGHLNPTTALCRELERRGHRVTFYQLPGGGQRKVEGAGFACRTYGEAEFSETARAEQLKRLAELKGLKALKYTVELLRLRALACLRDVPEQVRADGIDAMLVDQVSVEGPTIADLCGLPYATMSNALVLHPDPAVPPCFTSWRFGGGIFARLRNGAANRLLRSLTKPVIRTVNAHRAANNLRPYGGFPEAHSPLLQISQQPREFEYPRAHMPPHFHFTGPWVDPNTREPADFPWDRLDPAKPLVYASMGTLQNRLGEVFHRIAAACDGLGVQLVLSLGGGSTPEEVGPLPGSPIVVKFAPQLALLDRAALCVTHAGLNTAMECLARGVPMVAIPVTNDQPGVAARLAWCGAGVFLKPHKATAPRLRAAIENVLATPSYKASAQRLSQSFPPAGGQRLAADLIERTLIPAMRTPNAATAEVAA